MQTKLTLRLDNHLIVQAKLYAESTGKSLSQVVSDYFSALQYRSPRLMKSPKLPPLTQALKGILKSESALDENDYRQHLERKYR
jgi:hypothetical protein